MPPVRIAISSRLRTARVRHSTAPARPASGSSIGSTGNERSATSRIPTPKWPARSSMCSRMSAANHIAVRPRNTAVLVIMNSSAM